MDWELGGSLICMGEALVLLLHDSPGVGWGCGGSNLTGTKGPGDMIEPSHVGGTHHPSSPQGSKPLVGWGLGCLYAAHCPTCGDFLSSDCLRRQDHPGAHRPQEQQSCWDRVLPASIFTQEVRLFHRSLCTGLARRELVSQEF